MVCVGEADVQTPITISASKGENVSYYTALSSPSVHPCGGVHIRHHITEGVPWYGWLNGWLNGRADERVGAWEHGIVWIGGRMGACMGAWVGVWVVGGCMAGCNMTYTGGVCAHTHDCLSDLYLRTSCASSAANRDRICHSGPRIIGAVPGVTTSSANTDEVYFNTHVNGTSHPASTWVPPPQ